MGTPYRAFRFPLVASRLGREEVQVWGIAPEPGRVRIQARRAGGWRTLAVLRARGRSHPFLTRLRLSGPAALRATLPIGVGFGCLTPNLVWFLG